MTQWLEAHLTGSVYLTAASLATVLLLVQWAVLGAAGSHHALMRGRGMVRFTAAIALGAWAGLAAKNEWELAGLTHAWITLGTAAGVWVFITAWQRVTKSRRRSRAVSDARNAVSHQGSVYQRITPGRDSGLVDVTLGKRIVRLRARLKPGSDKPIEAFKPVKVLNADEDGVVTVEPANTPVA